LSFHYFEDFSSISKDEVAGEIIMSESRIQAQSVEHAHSLLSEFEILAIHGILHILGYDHEDEDDYEEMWEIENPIRDNFGLKF
jgi:probable rRNA maturation factor